MLILDHLAVACMSLEDGRAMVEEALGVKLQPGGQHPDFGTHNMLLGLDDGLYLEVIAINPDAPPPDRPRWFDLDRFHGPPRLTNWICRTDDLEGALALSPQQAGTPVSLRRGDLRWRMAVPDDGRLPFDQGFPALIEWQGDAHPAARLTHSGVRLERLIIRHPDAMALARIMQPLLADGRVAIESGPSGMLAEFATRRGQRALA